MARKKAVATTRIVHGKDKDRANNVVIEEGDEVKGLDRETMQHLIDIGSVTVVSGDEETEEAEGEGEKS